MKTRLSVSISATHKTGFQKTKAMTKKQEEVDELFNSLENPNDETIKWYHYLIHLGYYIPYAIKFFFSRPFRKEKRELKVLDQVQILIESNATDENIAKSKELTHLHRIIENTKARRRLEKWSLRVIAIYLFTVLLIVMSCYTSCDGYPIFVKIRSEIPPNIMIAILTTTTANIIGLGLIVLRGHFLAKEKMPDSNNEMERKENEMKQ